PRVGVAAIDGCAVERSVASFHQPGLRRPRVAASEAEPAQDTVVGPIFVQLEQRACIVAAPTIGCAVERSVARFHQPVLRIRSVAASGAEPEHGAVAAPVLVQLEDRASTAVAATGGRAVERPIARFHQTALRIPAVPLCATEAVQGAVAGPILV